MSASEQPASAMRPEVLWAIRDARGLVGDEKSLLWAVETRGEAWGTAETMAGDAGVSRASVFRYRKQLTDRGLLHVRKRHGERRKRYTVDADAVAALVPTKVSG